MSNLQFQAEEIESVKLFSFEQAILQLKDFGIQTYKKQLEQANKIVHNSEVKLWIENNACYVSERIIGF